jgi:hypothetical protein
MALLEIHKENDEFHGVNLPEPDSRFYCGSIFHEAARSAALHKAGVPSRTDWIGPGEFIIFPINPVDSTFYGWLIMENPIQMDG